MYMWILEKKEGRTWTGYISLSIGLLWTRQWNFVFHNMQEISWLA